MRRLVPLGLLAVATASLGCESDPAAAVRIDLGGGRTHEFVPKTAIARYLEVPGGPDELRIYLMGGKASCNEFVPPAKGLAFASVLVRVPDGQEITPGEYPWTGDLASVKEGAKSAVPVIGLEEGSRVLPAGGGVRLDVVDRRLHGEVTGQLLFSSAGASPEAKGPTKDARASGIEFAEGASLTGGFSARICAASVDPLRPTDGK